MTTRRQQTGETNQVEIDIAKRRVAKTLRGCTTMITPDGTETPIVEPTPAQRASLTLDDSDGIVKAGQHDSAFTIGRTRTSSGRCTRLDWTSLCTWRFG